MPCPRAVLAAALLLLTACAPIVPPAPPQAAPLLDAADAPPAPDESAAVLSALIPAPALAFVPAVPAAARPSSSALMPRPRQPLRQALDSALANQLGAIGVVVKDLASGETASLNADRQFRSASLYKLFVMQTAADQLGGGTLSFDEVLTLTPDLVAGDPYSDLPVGTRTTVDCALQTMLEASGNSAADLLVDRLGLQTINEHMAALGLTQSVITHETAFTSPADVARLLERLARTSTAPDGAISAYLVDMLARQQHSDRLPAPLPLGVRIAHKTGELPRLRHDAGIVYAPGGAYVFVAMVDDAPSEAAARATIVDLSEAVYVALEPGGPSLFRGLPPRLARDVFAVPDARSRIELLVDARTQTVPVPSEVAGVSEPIRLRAEALPDLLALHADAARAGVQFSVIDALRAPTDDQASQARPVVFVAPCAMDIPTPGDGLRHGQAPTPERPPGLTQQWLGTVVVLGDADGQQFSTPETDTPAGQWLLAHAWKHGFIPTPPETEAGLALGHEPWTFRWVGQTMAAHLHVQGARGPVAQDALRRAQLELSAQASRAHTPEILSAGADTRDLPCWAAPDTTTQGCPSRWFFSP